MEVVKETGGRNCTGKIKRGASVNQQRKRNANGTKTCVNIYVYLLKDILINFEAIEGKQ